MWELLSFLLSHSRTTFLPLIVLHQMVAGGGGGVADKKHMDLMPASEDTVANGGTPVEDCWVARIRGSHRAEEHPLALPPLPTVLIALLSRLQGSSNPWL